MIEILKNIIIQRSWFITNKSIVTFCGWCIRFLNWINKPNNFILCIDFSSLTSEEFANLLKVTSILLFEAVTDLCIQFIGQRKAIHLKSCKRIDQSDIVRFSVPPLTRPKISTLLSSSLAVWVLSVQSVKNWTQYCRHGPGGGV